MGSIRRLDPGQRKTGLVGSWFMASVLVAKAECWAEIWGLRPLRWVRPPAITGDSTLNWRRSPPAPGRRRPVGGILAGGVGTRMMRPMIRTTIGSQAGANSLLGIVFPSPRVLPAGARSRAPGQSPG